MRWPAKAVAAFAAGALVLAGCGSDNSTVSGDPTQTMAPPPSSPTGTQTPPTATGGGQYTEAPDSVEPDAPGYDEPVVGARERGYLAALESEGVETDALGDSLVATGNTICTIRSTGGAAQETDVIANAVAGQIVEGGHADMTEEEVASIVIDTAAGQLCP